MAHIYQVQTIQSPDDPDLFFVKIQESTNSFDREIKVVAEPSYYQYQKGSDGLTEVEASQLDFELDSDNVQKIFINSTVYESEEDNEEVKIKKFQQSFEEAKSRTKEYLDNKIQIREETKKYSQDILKPLKSVGISQSDNIPRRHEQEDTYFAYQLDISQNDLASLDDDEIKDALKEASHQAQIECGYHFAGAAGVVSTVINGTAFSIGLGDCRVHKVTKDGECNQINTFIHHLDKNPEEKQRFKRDKLITIGTKLTGSYGDVDQRILVNKDGNMPITLEAIIQSTKVKKSDKLVAATDGADTAIKNIGEIIRKNKNDNKKSAKLINDCAIKQKESDDVTVVVSDAKEGCLIGVFDGHSTSIINQVERGDVVSKELSIKFPKIIQNKLKNKIELKKQAKNTQKNTQIKTQVTTDEIVQTSSTNPQEKTKYSLEYHKQVDLDGNKEEYYIRITDLSSDTKKQIIYRCEESAITKELSLIYIDPNNKDYAVKFPDNGTNIGEIEVENCDNETAIGNKIQHSIKLDNNAIVLRSAEKKEEKEKKDQNADQKDEAIRNRRIFKYETSLNTLIKYNFIDFIDEEIKRLSNFGLYEQRPEFKIRAYEALRNYILDNLKYGEVDKSLRDLIDEVKDQYVFVDKKNKAHFSKDPPPLVNVDADKIFVKQKNKYGEITPITFREIISFNRTSSDENAKSRVTSLINFNKKLSELSQDIYKVAESPSIYQVQIVQSHDKSKFYIKIQEIYPPNSTGYVVSPVQDFKPIYAEFSKDSKNLEFFETYNTNKVSELKGVDWDSNNVSKLYVDSIVSDRKINHVKISQVHDVGNKIANHLINKLNIEKLSNNYPVDDKIKNITAGVAQTKNTKGQHDQEDTHFEDQLDKEFTEALKILSDNEIKEVLLQASNQAQIECGYHLWGSTGVVCTVINGITYTISLGDSLAYKVSSSGSCTHLNPYLHNKDNQVERKRLSKIGIEPISLNMTASYGDVDERINTNEKGVSPLVLVPKITSVKLNKGDSIVLGSDGINYLSPAEIGATVNGYKNIINLKYKNQGAANAINTKAKEVFKDKAGKEKQKKDDVTVVVDKAKEGILIGVFDGHSSNSNIERGNKNIVAEQLSLKFPTIIRNGLKQAIELKKKPQAAYDVAYARAQEEYQKQQPIPDNDSIPSGNEKHYEKGHHPTFPSGNEKHYEKGHHPTLPGVYYVERQGKRKAHEDATVMGTVDKKFEVLSTKAIGDALKETVKKLQEKHGKALRIGSTLNACVVINGTIIVINVGDSAAYCLEKMDDGNITCNRLNRIHNAHSNASELERIRGLKIDDNRINITQALGDLLSGWIICKPEVYFHTFDSNKQNNITLLIACDGAAEGATVKKDPNIPLTEEYIKKLEEECIIKRVQNIDDVSKIPTNLANNAIGSEIDTIKDENKPKGNANPQSEDNVSAIAVDLTKNENGVYAVFDGHGGDEVSKGCAADFYAFFTAELVKQLELKPIIEAAEAEKKRNLKIVIDELLKDLTIVIKNVKQQYQELPEGLKNAGTALTDNNIDYLAKMAQIEAAFETADTANSKKTSRLGFFAAPKIQSNEIKLINRAVKNFTKYYNDKNVSNSIRDFNSLVETQLKFDFIAFIDTEIERLSKLILSGDQRVKINAYRGLKNYILDDIRTGDKKDFNTLINDAKLLNIVKNQKEGSYNLSNQSVSDDKALVMQNTHTAGAKPLTLIDLISYDRSTHKIPDSDTEKMKIKSYSNFTREVSRLTNLKNKFRVFATPDTGPKNVM